MNHLRLERAKYYLITTDQNISEIAAACGFDDSNYFSRKFKAPIIPIFIVRKEGYYGHQAIVKDPIYYEDTGDRQLDDYRVTLKMTRIVEEVIREYPDNWLWFQHRWNTPYTPTGKEQEHVEK